MVERKTVLRARKMRRQLTPPEARLWTALKGEKLDGFKFRRQHPVGPFILDFYCAEVKLAVEVDGLGHDYRIEQDARRTAWLGEQGISVLRVPAEDVRVNLEGVAMLILETARRLRD